MSMTVQKSLKYDQLCGLRNKKINIRSHYNYCTDSMLTVKALWQTYGVFLRNIGNTIRSIWQPLVLMNE